MRHALSVFMNIIRPIFAVSCWLSIIGYPVRYGEMDGTYSHYSSLKA